MSVSGSYASSPSLLAKRAPRKQTLSVLVCGATGTGKTSFINTFVGQELLQSSSDILTGELETKLRLIPTTVELDETMTEGTRLLLTLIDTEGFGAALDHSGDVEQLAEFIENRFDEVLAEESRIRRNPRFKDNRVDVCLYFIEPTGHGLRELDILTLRRLSLIVNLVPVLARADQLTLAERAANKRLVMEDLRAHDIEIFDFHYDVEDETEEVEDPEIAAALPLAVMSSSEFDSDGHPSYKRQLTFGVVDLLDAKQSDFVLLREALLVTYRNDLKDRTRDVLYETYRTNKLDPQQNHRSSLLLPQELADHAARLKEAQIARETADLREESRRVTAELDAKRALLLKRERQLREVEQRMAEQLPMSDAVSDAHFEDASSGWGTVDASSAGGSSGSAINANGADGAATSIARTGSASDPGSAPEADTSIDASNPYIAPTNEPSQEQRIRQTRSKNELRQHAEKLHAEVADLEAQQANIQQRQLATEASTRNLHAQLEGNGTSETQLPPTAPQAVPAPVTSAQAETQPRIPQEPTQPPVTVQAQEYVASETLQYRDTSPLQIKKATAT